jgi:hypothetical protein
MSSVWPFLRFSGFRDRYKSRHGLILGLCCGFVAIDCARTAKRRFGLGLDGLAGFGMTKTKGARLEPPSQVVQHLAPVADLSILKVVDGHAEAFNWNSVVGAVVDTLLHHDVGSYLPFAYDFVV